MRTNTLAVLLASCLVLFAALVFSFACAELTAELRRGNDLIEREARELREARKELKRLNDWCADVMKRLEAP